MGLNLEVSLEMCGHGLGSNTTAVTFECAQIALNPSDYDGATYYFEINAFNSDSSDRTVYLVNSGGTTQASITVPSGGSSGDYKRYISSSWTPAAGENNYRLKLDATNSAYQLGVYPRVKIVQVDATKTRLPFDLLTSDSTLYGGSLSNSSVWNVLARNAVASSHPDSSDPRFAIFGYDSSLWSGSVTYEFESLAYRTGAAGTCYVRLYRNSNGNTVNNAELTVSASSPTIYRATIGSDTEWVSGNDYEADVHSTSALSYSAACWAKIFVKVTSVTAVRVFHLIGAGNVHGAGDGTGISEERHRYLYTADNYTAPTPAWELTAMDTGGDGTCRPTLDHYGTNDGPGTTGDTEVADKALGTKARAVETPTVTDTYRYGYGSKRPVGGAFRLFNTHLVVDAEIVQDAAQTRVAGDDLDNWADAIRHDHPDQGTTQGDTLDNWDDSVRHDFPEQASAYSDDLNNWSDGLDIVLGFTIQKSDDLDNWLDNKSYDLAASGALTESKTDDLNNWAETLKLGYGLKFSEDLDNWNDAAVSDIPQKTYSFGDDLNNWLDGVNVGIHELTEQVGDSLNNWLDNAVVEFPEKTYSFGDDLNNWQDIVRHNFPYIYLQFGDTLNMQDGINKFGQPYPEDTLNYWQDNISILMPSNLRYQVFVDWENDGTFGTVVDNITSDVYEMTWTYGRDYASQLTGNSVAGQATILLRNTTGKYNKFKTTSPIYGNILPGRKIKILMHTSDTSTQMWSGFLDTIESTPSIHGAHTAKLMASGPISQINEKSVNVAIQNNVYTGNAVAAVLDAAGWPGSDRVMDTGYIFMNRWWTGGKILALTAIRRLEDTEAGFFRETKDGKLAYEDKFHRLKIDNFVSKATFRDVPGVSVVYSDIHQEDPLKEIYNIVETEVKQFTLGDAGAILWTLEEQPAIAPQATIEIWAACPSASTSSGAVAADEWITPTPADYIAGSSPGLSDMTGFLSIVETKFDTGMKMLCTNTSPTTTIYITQLQARGTALYESYATNVRAEDTDSQSRYGERTWPASDTYFVSRAEAEGYVQWILGAYNLPRPIINLEFSTYRNSELTEAARTLDVSDMIDIEANATTKLGINHKFFIEKITHRVTDDGLDHRVLFECSCVVGAAFIERSVGDNNLNNWNDHINVALGEVHYARNKTVVIHEMFGQGHSSRNSANGGAYQTNFATLTIDPSKFNGVVKCEWEIVADNYDSSSKDIDLYQSGSKIATLSVGAGQYYYRTSTEITWPSSTKYYVIEIPETTDFEDVAVYRSRIKIYQEDATATQIQIMFQGDGNYGWNYWGSPCSFQGGDYYPYVAWDSNETDWVRDDAISELFKDAYCRWTYDASHWGTINAMTLEAAMGIEPGGVSCTGYFRLYDEDTAQQVGSWVSLDNDASPNCPNSDEQTVSINPALLNDGDTYTIQGKISVSSAYVTSYRTCLYLELAEGLDAFESYYDMGREGTSVYWDMLTHYFDFGDFGHISYVKAWAEAATSSPKQLYLTDGSSDYGHLGFISSSYAILEQEFNHRQMSVGNHYTRAGGSQLRLRAHRIVVYQNVNELGMIDDLNNWNDGISKTLGP